MKNLREKRNTKMAKPMNTMDLRKSTMESLARKRKRKTKLMNFSQKKKEVINLKRTHNQPRRKKKKLLKRNRQRPL